MKVSNIPTPLLLLVVYIFETDKYVPMKCFSTTVSLQIKNINFEIKKCQFKNNNTKFKKVNWDTLNHRTD